MNSGKHRSVQDVVDQLELIQVKAKELINSNQVMIRLAENSMCCGNCLYLDFFSGSDTVCKKHKRIQNPKKSCLDHKLDGKTREERLD